MYKNNQNSYGLMMVVLMVSFTIGMISAAKTAPSSLASTITANDIKSLAGMIESHRPSNGGMYDNDLKETYFAVGALTRLDRTVEKDGELCKKVRATIEERSNDIESVFYGVSVLSELKCLAANPVPLTLISSSVQKALDNGNINELAAAVNTVFLLLDAKSITYEVTNLESAANRLVSFMDADGEFKLESGSDDASITNNGVAYFTMARLSHRLKSVAGISNLVDKIVSKLPAVVASASDSASGFMWNDLATTSSILRGIIGLTSQSDKVSNTITPLQIQRIGDYLLKFKGTTSLEDAFNMVIGLRSCKKNPIGQPLSVVLTPTAFDSSASGKKVVTIEVRDIFDAPVAAQSTVTKVALATARNTAIISNKELSADNKLDVTELKLGSYIADIKITPTDESYSPILITRTITISGAAAVRDFKVVVADTKEGLTNSKQVFPVESQNKLSLSLPANKTARVFFRVVSGDQPFVAQQVGVRFVSKANSAIETVVQAVFSVDSYTYIINGRDLGKLLNFVSGAYQVEVLVGDSSIAPLTWQVGQLVLSFDQAATGATRYPAHQAIEHRFRVPEARPPQVVSQAFTLAVLAPLAIFLIGLPVLGANLKKFPGGMGFIYTVAFIGCVALVGLLIITYWLSLTMVVTLRYLGLLLIPTVFFGQKSLSHFAQERVNKPKQH